MKYYHLEISESQLADFCQRWLIAEFALFGSVIRDDFHAESDIDVLVTFTPEANWSLLDHCGMELELGDIVQRKVQILTKRSVEQSRNKIMRREILNTAKVIYTG